MQASEGDTLARIEALVEKNSEAISKLQEDVRRWDERFFQHSRDNITLARAILVASFVAVLLSPALAGITPVIQQLVSGLVGQQGGS
ncbi:hypothetical protein DO97_18390 [Neosynechococcus sphagnicola sy1]|uniref:Uncharacterized protein n=1 Tax=Neosynechococcus sphagnicola sy1 TaxID=1497020 RepID=A0A098TMF3_9CYAN|nr:hypothetical protein [Neosynechococcus sphagnicola]KGF73484.1 hypothetical protein DO97_18390 [Neosynechococcus sphagnicola sy1]